MYCNALHRTTAQCTTLQQPVTHENKREDDRMTGTNERTERHEMARYEMGDERTEGHEMRDEMPRHQA